jgi:hypothetical protein
MRYGLKVLGVLCILPVLLRGQNSSAASEQMKKLYSTEVYQTKVVNVFPVNNAPVFRNKMVETLDSLLYFIDYKGNSVLLGSTAQFYVPNVVTINGAQSITGKKIFTDTVVAENGLKSGGVIDTKGLSTKGSSSQSAMSIQGAIAEKDTIIDADNFQTDWSYGVYVVRTLTGNKTVRLPPIGAKNDWSMTFKNETLDANGFTLFIKDSNGNDVYKLTGKILVKFKIKNLTWGRESVSLF